MTNRCKIDNKSIENWQQSCQSQWKVDHIDSKSMTIRFKINDKSNQNRWQINNKSIQNQWQIDDQSIQNRRRLDSIQNRLRIDIKSIITIQSSLKIHSQLMLNRRQIDSESTKNRCKIDEKSTKNRWYRFKTYTNSTHN